MENIESKLTDGLTWLVLQYRRWVSQALPARCRFYPSCSSYAITVLQQNRLWSALQLIAKRLLKCRPGGDHGIDWPPTQHKEEHK